MIEVLLDELNNKLSFLISFFLHEQRREVLQSIQDAMLDRETLFISYRKPDGRIYDYEVEPYEVKQKGKTRCLYGYDVDEGTIKCFNIRRILRADTTGDNFRPRWRIKPIVI